MNLKMCEVVTDVDKLKVDLQATIMKYTTIKQWAYIVHDRDDTRAHYHIALHFGGASVSTKQIAEWFKLGYVDEQGVEHSGEQFVERVKCKRWSGIINYLIHGQDSQRNKHQYSEEEVVANFDVKTTLENEKIIGDFDKYSYAQMLQYVDSLPISEKTAAYSKLKKLWEIRCQTSTLNTDRNIEVVFVTGKAGTGKTYYAKKFLTGLGYDFCISSSSNDLFQDYLGQRAMILDDVRDRTFSSFEELLKILDRNTSSSVRSRFVNKFFFGEMIVITSSVPIRYWFRAPIRKNGEVTVVADEDLNQLYRRISCYVEVTEKEIIVYDDGLDEFGKPLGLGQVFANELAAMKGESRQKFDFKSAFKKICDSPVDLEFSADPEQLKFDSEV